MISCNLGEKQYIVDFISGRALREMEPAMTMYSKVVRVANSALENTEASVEDAPSIPEAMDVMVKWFCLLFNNQFKPDDVYDCYPVDRLMHDIVLALLAVQSQTTDILDEFPTTAAKENPTPETATETT